MWAEVNQIAALDRATLAAGWREPVDGALLGSTISTSSTS
jgi:hypothetical protein